MNKVLFSILLTTNLNSLGGLPEKASNGCSVDKTKDNFFSACTAYEENQLGVGDQEISDESQHKIRKECGCVALEFNIEDVTWLPACDFTKDYIKAIIKRDLVQKYCGDL